ncbi:MAG: putative RND superfamily exporter protein [Halioglobus sp.]|jgi:predicted RND superfamily exporter protein
MLNAFTALYDRLILGRPFATLGLVVLIIAAFGTQLNKITLDASADALLLKGDPSLEYFREVSREYSSEEFVLVTWKPYADLLSPESLLPLRELAEELRELEGVSSVVTIWDVPLLESPPVSLSDITSGDPLPTLELPGIDLDLVREELTTSPIYADLLASRDGTLTAVQVNLERDEIYSDMLQTRDELRKLESGAGLSPVQATQLQEAEAEVKTRNAVALQKQSNLVASVRTIVAGYSEHAQLFVGGVPMIASDMVGYVQSDLLLFGGAILGIMVLVLAIVFREIRWVFIPLLTCNSTVIVMLGLLGALDWRMTVISSNFVAVLLIISLALSIHLIVRYRELHALEPDGVLHDRVLNTVRLMIVPCVYTGITTVVAFVSLVVSGIQPVIDFGLMMTVGIVVALFMAFMLVPCLMLVWPDGNAAAPKEETPPLTLYFARVADRFGGSILIGSLLLLVTTIYGISRLEVENRFIDYFHESTEIYQGMELLDAQLGGTISMDIIISAPDFDAPLPGLENLSTDAAPVDEDDPFLDDEDFSTADALAVDEGLGDEDWSDEFGDDEFADDGGFGGGFDDGFASEGEDDFQPSYWFSLGGMRQLDKVHNYIDALPETGKVLSLSTVFAVVKDLMGEDVGSVELALVQKSLSDDIKEMMVDPYFSLDKEQVRLNVRVKETSKTLRRNDFLIDVREHITTELGLAPEQVELTGMLVLYNNVLQSLFRSQILTLGVVFGAILIMFLLLFRSLSLALIALAPNLLAAGMVLGMMGLVGIPLDIMTITIAAIVLGIGVDNCIHYVHRFMHEFPKDRDYTATMYRCHQSIGRALYYTTVTVVVGFSMLTLSNFNPSIYFGVLTVLAMAAAVIGALLLLPRLIIVFKALGPEGTQ